MYEIFRLFTHVLQWMDFDLGTSNECQYNGYNFIFDFHNYSWVVIMFRSIGIYWFIIFFRLGCTTHKRYKIFV